MNGLLEESTYRWLHYSLNLIGDPETPIYTTIPREFSNVNIEFNSDGLVEVHTGIKDTRICVTSKSDPNIYEVINGSDAVFDLPDGPQDFCITAQNYKPKLISFTHYGATNKWYGPETKILSLSPNPATSNVTVKYRLNAVDNNELTLLILTNVYGGEPYDFDITGGDGTVSIDISNVPAGLYIANLCFRGQLYESQQRLIINK